MPETSTPAEREAASVSGERVPPFAAEKRQILAIWRKLGYSMTSLDTRVRRAFGCPCFVWLKNEEQISTLLSDLQRREKAFDRRHIKDRVGA